MMLKFLMCSASIYANRSEYTIRANRRGEKIKASRRLQAPIPRAVPGSAMVPIDPVGVSLRERPASIWRIFQVKKAWKLSETIVESNDLRKPTRPSPPAFLVGTPSCGVQVGAAARKAGNSCEVLTRRPHQSLNPSH